VIIVADTGPLYALIDKSDAWHERVVRWWSRNTRPIIVPVTVLPEVAYLLGTRIGPAAEARFIRAVADGEFEVEQLLAMDIERAAELSSVYADLPLGFVDATIVAVAERNETRDILTTDLRHFSVVRPLHARRFNILPGPLLEVR
jgi:hypothetical protein